MLRKPHCWSVQQMCSREPGSPFYRQRPPLECSLALWIVLVSGVVSLVIALVAFGVDDRQTFSFFIGAFFVLELVAIFITFLPCIRQAFTCFRSSREYYEVTEFTPSTSTEGSGYGTLVGIVSPFRHTPLYAAGTRLPPLTPHKSVASDLVIPTDDLLVWRSV